MYGQQWPAYVFNVVVNLVRWCSVPRPSRKLMCWKFFVAFLLRGLRQAYFVNFLFCLLCSQTSRTFIVGLRFHCVLLPRDTEGDFFQFVRWFLCPQGSRRLLFITFVVAPDSQGSRQLTFSNFCVPSSALFGSLGPLRGCPGTLGADLQCSGIVIGFGIGMGIVDVNWNWNGRPFRCRCRSTRCRCRSIAKLQTHTICENK